jgi:hypothetical protein
MNFNVDSNINPWFKNTMNEEYLNRILNIGYYVDQNLSIKDDTNDRVIKYLEKLENTNNTEKKYIIDHFKNCSDNYANQINNLASRITEINDKSNKSIENANLNFNNMILDFTGKSKTSSIRGLMAENFLQNTIEEFFKDDQCNVTSQSAHEADIQLISNDHPTILIESKNYSNVVPSKEVAKFNEDMVRTNSKLGIFFSFNSKVIGIKNNIEIVKTDNSSIQLFITNISMDVKYVVFAIKFIKFISANLNSDSKNINLDLINNNAIAITESLKKVNDIFVHLSNCRFTLNNERNNMLKSLDNILSSYYDNEACIKSITNSIINTIDSKLQKLLDNEYLINNKPNNHVNNIDDILLNIDVNQDNLKKILTQFDLKGFKLIQKEKKIYFYDTNNEESGNITYTKTKIKINLAVIDASFVIQKNNFSSLEACFKILNK